MASASTDDGVRGCFAIGGTKSFRSTRCVTATGCDLVCLAIRIHCRLTERGLSTFGNSWLYRRWLRKRILAWYRQGMGCHRCTTGACRHTLLTFTEADSSEINDPERSWKIGYDDMRVHSLLALSQGQLAVGSGRDVRLFSSGGELVWISAFTDPTYSLGLLPNGFILCLGLPRSCGCSTCGVALALAALLWRGPLVLRKAITRVTIQRQRHAGLMIGSHRGSPLQVTI